MAYLNKEGLAHFWANLKSKFYTKSEIDLKLKDYYTQEQVNTLLNQLPSGNPSYPNGEEMRW